jgi:hypothetical protein
VTSVRAFAEGRAERFASLFTFRAQITRAAVSSEWLGERKEPLRQRRNFRQLRSLAFLKDQPNGRLVAREIYFPWKRNVAAANKFPRRIPAEHFHSVTAFVLASARGAVRCNARLC